MRRRRLLPGAAFGILLFAGGASAAGAAEVEIRAANQLEGYYDTKLEESVADDRLDVELRYDRFSAGIVFLSHTPSNPQFLDPNLFGPHVEGIRKRWVTASHGPIDLRLGDSYASFGSGMVLRIIEDQAVDFDNGVDGFHIEAALRRLTLEGIGGTNSYREARTIVKGLSSRLDAGKGWTFSMNGALIDSVIGDAPRPGRDGIGGMEAVGSLPGNVSVTGEYAIRHYTPERRGVRSPADGHAAYAAVSGGAGPVILLAEGKDLLRFKHAYAIPPTAVRQHSSTLLNRGSHVPNIRLDDERGFQAEAILALGPEASLTGNYSASEARHAALPAWEAFGQLEGERFGSHWILRAAEQEERVIEGDHRTLFERATFGGNWQRRLGDWSLEVGYETQGIRKQNIARRLFETAREYRDQITTLTLGRAPRHSWAATVEWTDDALSAKKSWLWLEWNVRLGLLGQLTLGGGSLRGGQVCSGGVCKIVSPFEGGRVELLTNF